jgi:hypothetical protein
MPTSDRIEYLRQRVDVERRTLQGRRAALQRLETAQLPGSDIGEGRRLLSMHEQRLLRLEAALAAAQVSP